MKGLYRFFNENQPTFKSDKQTRMTCCGKSIDYTDESGINRLFTADVVLKFDLIDWHRLPGPEKVEVLKNFIEHNFRQDLIEKRRSESEVMEKIANATDGLDLLDPDWIMATLKPARLVGDVRKEGGFVFINSETSEVTPFDYHTIALALERAYDKKVAQIYLNNFVAVKPFYDPHSGPFFQQEGTTEQVYNLNLYTPPPWRKMEGIEPAYPEDIEYLVNHLFIDDDSKEFFFTWVYHSLTSRAQTYLYLQGGQGSGKNTVAEILAAIHGQDNSSNPRGSSLGGRFNRFLKNKTFVFLDEFSSRSRKDKDLLKYIVNDRIQIESKGENHEDIDITASYLIANNSPEAITLDPIDRRFSVPHITDENILYKKSPEWMNSFKDKIKDPAYIGAFAKWILKNYSKPKWSEVDPFQGEKFEAIVIATAREGIKHTVDKIIQKEDPTYNYYDEKHEFERKTRSRAGFPHISDWTKYFTDLKVKGEPVCVVDGVELVVSHRFCPGEGDSEALPR